MSASERSASERDVPAQQQPPRVAVGVSMRDLLASCAAAEAVSRPPRAPLPDAAGVEQPRKAA
ncbi:hypothetical protein [Streptomyces sp. NBC_00620]|uniref:hypothetical protein n=1 Tax=Streptomyces sp. NBC_00620 TaxID=2903666 RepID=UPI0022559D64|nr:hypothetical protein [Streptomyces sp. NBC_00620]MCX4972080.1 hypothetical protein [Streptomyces sp. NBC_00620]